MAGGVFGAFGRTALEAGAKGAAEPTLSAGTKLPPVEMAEQVVEGEDVSRVVAIAIEDDVRPAPHACRRIAVAAEPEFVPGNRANEDAFVGRRPVVEFEK